MLCTSCTGGNHCAGFCSSQTSSNHWACTSGGCPTGEEGDQEGQACCHPVGGGAASRSASGPIHCRSCSPASAATTGCTRACGRSSRHGGSRCTCSSPTAARVSQMQAQPKGLQAVQKPALQAPWATWRQGRQVTAATFALGAGCQSGHWPGQPVGLLSGQSGYWPGLQMRGCLSHLAQGM